MKPELRIEFEYIHINLPIHHVKVKTKYILDGEQIDFTIFDGDAEKSLFYFLEKYIGKVNGYHSALQTLNILFDFKFYNIGGLK